jgi:hypothetical protein
VLFLAPDYGDLADLIELIACENVLLMGLAWDSRFMAHDIGVEGASLSAHLCLCFIASDRAGFPSGTFV